jgi:hypothetical protein
MKSKNYMNNNISNIFIHPEAGQATEEEVAVVIGAAEADIEAAVADMNSRKMRSKRKSNKS